MENIAQAFTPPPGRCGHSMPTPERVGSPLERMSFRAIHRVSKIFSRCLFFNNLKCFVAQCVGEEGHCRWVGAPFTDKRVLW